MREKSNYFIRWFAHVWHVTVGSSIGASFFSSQKNTLGAAWLKGYVCYCVFCKIERYIFFHTRIAFAVGRATPFRYAMTFIAVILIDREGSWLLDRFLLFLLCPFPTTLSTCLYRVRCEGGYLRVHGAAMLFAIDECMHKWLRGSFE